MLTRKNMLSSKNIMLLIAGLISFGFLGDLCAGGRKTPSKTPGKTPTSPNNPTDEQKRREELEKRKKEEKDKAREERRVKDREIARIRVEGDPKRYNEFLTLEWDAIASSIKEFEDRTLAQQKELKDEAEAYAKDPKKPKPLEDPIADKDLTRHLVDGVTKIFKTAARDVKSALGDKSDATGWAEKEGMYNSFISYLTPYEVKEKAVMMASGGRGRGRR